MLLYIHRKFKGVHSIHGTNLHLYSFVHKNTYLHKYMYYYALLIKNLSEISSNDYPQISLSLFVKFFEIPFDNRDTFKIHPANNEPSFFFNATASNWKQQRSNKMNANLRSSFFEKKFLKSTENSPIKSWTRDPNNFHRVIKREIVEEDNRFFFFFFRTTKGR